MMMKSVQNGQISLLCDFKSVSLQRCETNKPPAMRVRIEGYTVITKTLQTSYNIGVQANCKTKGVKTMAQKAHSLSHNLTATKTLPSIRLMYSKDWPLGWRPI